MNALRMTLRTHAVAARCLLLLTLVLGLAYPLAVTGVGQLALPWQANGSPLAADGATVGSALIGQTFTNQQGKPLQRYFQSRPSAAGDGYDGAASGGSNLGPQNPELVATITQRRKDIATLEAVAPADIPADALTASASGLDPQISPEYALLQVRRVAAARGLPEAAVQRLVEASIQGRELGFLGEPTVNVLRLNLATDGLKD
ncbi:potassium-transporting ATPase subunit KdpC [Arthrobacter rhombi]|uniref:potassium-transporting ATPase subunit KdpC n=1 Tax=Arthrobacter rhombi TaxID=71253 RepID=UPI003F8E8746